MVCTVFSPCSLLGRIFTLQASEEVPPYILIIASNSPGAEVLFDNDASLKFQNSITTASEPNTMSYENWQILTQLRKGFVFSSLMLK